MITTKALMVIPMFTISYKQFCVAVISKHVKWSYPLLS